MSATVECYCCGEERDPAMVAALRCHDDIKVCRICVGWLMRRAGGVDVTPTLPVSSMNAATGFYETAGFDVRRYDDGFAFVSLNDQSVFDLDLVESTDPVANGAGCYIITDDVEQWHERLVAAGLPVTSVEDQPWDMREFTLTDPSGNHIRIGNPTPDTD
jgi:predicted enzyme related to lactoylglutathione lyase